MQSDRIILGRRCAGAVTWLASLLLSLGLAGTASGVVGDGDGTTCTPPNPSANSCSTDADCDSGEACVPYGNPGIPCAPSGCGCVNGSWLCTAVCASQCASCTLAGDCDDFVPGGPPVFLRTAFANWFAANANHFCDNSAPSLPFDEVNDADCAFGYSFEGLSNLCCPATLEIHLRAGPSIPSTDSLNLVFNGTSFAWGRSLDDLDALNAFCNHASGIPDGAWSAGEDMTCVLDLCALPLAGGGTIDVTQSIASIGALDVYVQDDTGVDCIGLCNSICPCIKNAAVSIDLSTAVGGPPEAPICLAPPQDDDTWKVVCDASFPANGPLGRPATVVAEFPGWDTLPNSCTWVSINANQGNNVPNGDYCYETCFCLNDGFQNASLSFDILADDGADVYLNTDNGQVLAQTLLVTTPNPAFHLPATHFPTSSTPTPPFVAGKNCIEVVVHNTGFIVTGFDLTGQFTAENAQCCCEPLADGSGCRPAVCPEDGDPVQEQCRPKCVRWDPETGRSLVEECNCIGTEECHVGIPGPPGVPCGGVVAATAAVGPNGCVALNDAGTVVLPPPCSYLSPEDVHEIVGLPGGSTIELGIEHQKFNIQNSGSGGSLGGEFEQFHSFAFVNLCGTGALDGFSSSAGISLLCETHIGPRTPGDPVQSFDTVMFRMEGQTSNAAFALLKITAGTDFGMPSPGHTTLTLLPGGVSFAVDSYFDIQYRIEFTGAPGGPLAGLVGDHTGTIRMSTGGAPHCVGNCPPGTVCVETVTPQADGTVKVCCDCPPCPDCCAVDSDCDDGDNCSRDSCVDGICVHTGGTVVEADNALVVAGAYSNNIARFLRSTGGLLGPFISSGPGVSVDPYDVAFGPDGHLYVSSYATDNVLCFDWPSGGFLGVFVRRGAGGLGGPKGLLFGPDGDLYVASFDTDSVIRYDGTTGSFRKNFVPRGSGGLDGPTDLVFGPDGNLYVTSFNNNSVKRYHYPSGGSLGSFVPSGTGGLNGPTGLTFGPDGNLYVSSFNTDAVHRFLGRNGGSLGKFVRGGAGGLDGPVGLAFGPEGDLYVASFNSDVVNLYSGVNGGFLDRVVPRGSGVDGPTAVLVAPFAICSLKK